MKNLFSRFSSLILTLALVVSIFPILSGSANASACTYVNGYYRKSGTYVSGYWRGDCSTSSYTPSSDSSTVTPQPAPVVPLTPVVPAPTSAPVVQPIPPASEVKKPTVSTATCSVNGGLQDKTCTPGNIFANATKDMICKVGYTKAVRNVSLATKKKVFAVYGLKYKVGLAFEVDHLIPLELGGSNDISNLWPEAANPQPGFHQKDKVENYLHQQVCSGALSLQGAQQQISADWTSVYKLLTK